MKLSSIANVVDIEHDDGRLIEIGITTVNIDTNELLQTYSLPIKPDFELSPRISELTGWTTGKLLKQGISKEETIRRLGVYGFGNRLLVSDHSDEIPFIEQSLESKFSPHRLNISILFFLITGKNINIGLDAMLAEYNLQFEGTLHSASDDSRNIARLFLKLVSGLRITKT